MASSSTIPTNKQPESSMMSQPAGSPPATCTPTMTNLTAEDQGRPLLTSPTKSVSSSMTTTTTTTTELSGKPKDDCEDNGRGGATTATQSRLIDYTKRRAEVSPDSKIFFRLRRRARRTTSSSSASSTSDCGWPGGEETTSFTSSSSRLFFSIGQRQQSSSTTTTTSSPTKRYNRRSFSFGQTKKSTSSDRTLTNQSNHKETTTTLASPNNQSTTSSPKRYEALFHLSRQESDRSFKERNGIPETPADQSLRSRRSSSLISSEQIPPPLPSGYDALVSCGDDQKISSISNNQPLKKDSNETTKTEATSSQPPSSSQLLPSSAAMEESSLCSCPSMMEQTICSMSTDGSRKGTVDRSLIDSIANSIRMPLGKTDEPPQEDAPAENTEESESPTSVTTLFVGNSSTTHSGGQDTKRNPDPEEEFHKLMPHSKRHKPAPPVPSAAPAAANEDAATTMASLTTHGHAQAVEVQNSSPHCLLGTKRTSTPLMDEGSEREQPPLSHTPLLPMKRKSPPLTASEESPGRELRSLSNSQLPTMTDAAAYRDGAESCCSRGSVRERLTKRRRHCRSRSFSSAPGGPADGLERRPRLVRHCSSGASVASASSRKSSASRLPTSSAVFHLGSSIRRRRGSCLSVLGLSTSESFLCNSQEKTRRTLLESRRRQHHSQQGSSSSSSRGAAGGVSNNPGQTRDASSTTRSIASASFSSLSRAQQKTGRALLQARLAARRGRPQQSSMRSSGSVRSHGSRGSVASKSQRSVSWKCQQAGVSTPNQARPAAANTSRSLPGSSPSQPLQQKSSPSLPPQKKTARALLQERLAARRGQAHAHRSSLRSSASCRSDAASHYSSRSQKSVTWKC